MAENEGTNKAVAVVVGNGDVPKSVDGEVIRTSDRYKDVTIKVVDSVAAVLIRILRTFLQVFIASFVGVSVGGSVPVVSDALPSTSQFNERLMAAVYLALLSALIAGAQRAYEILTRVDDKFPTWTA